MPKPLGTLINDLAIKAGAKADNQALKDLLANAELSKIVLPDDFVGTIESGLHTLDSAEPHLKTKLKQKLFAEAYDGLDAELNRIMEEEQLDDETKQTLLGEKSSTKRAVLLTKKIKELETKKAGALKNTDKEKLAEEINLLKKQLNDAGKEKTSEIEKLKSLHEGELINAKIRASLASYNYALGDLDSEVKIDTAYNTLQKELSKEGVKIISDGGQLKLVKTADNTDHYDTKNNTKVDLKSFMDSSLSRNKLLKSTDSSDKDKSDTNDNDKKIAPDKDAPKLDQGALASVDEQLKSFSFK